MIEIEQAQQADNYYNKDLVKQAQAVSGTTDLGQQTGLAGMLPQLQRADISTLGQLGALNKHKHKLNLMHKEKQ